MDNYYSNNYINQEPHMTTFDWIITFLIMLIPVVNFIMVIVWAIGAKNLSKRNFFRAFGLFSIIIFFITFLGNSL